MCIQPARRLRLRFNQDARQATDLAEQRNGGSHVWAHIGLGEIFDTTRQRDRAIREYQAAVGTRDDMGAVTPQLNRLFGVQVN